MHVSCRVGDIVAWIMERWWELLSQTLGLGGLRALERLTETEGSQIRAMWAPEAAATRAAGKPTQTQPPIPSRQNRFVRAASALEYIKVKESNFPWCGEEPPNNTTMRSNMTGGSDTEGKNTSRIIARGQIQLPRHTQHLHVIDGGYGCSVEVKQQDSSQFFFWLLVEITHTTFFKYSSCVPLDKVGITQQSFEEHSVIQMKQWWWKVCFQCVAARYFCDSDIDLHVSAAGGQHHNQQGLSRCSTPHPADPAAAASVQHLSKQFHQTHVKPHVFETSRAVKQLKPAEVEVVLGGQSNWDTILSAAVNFDSGWSHPRLQWVVSWEVKWSLLVYLWSPCVLKDLRGGEQTFIASSSSGANKTKWLVELFPF